ncbi:MAG: 30S ribosomal protein S8 [Thermoproteus sp. AZ2]|jgi:small subunit ribosomal protein S8|uniref:30S ribosomal protein S8 n=1 Tax=Thermoproteus sp. AZ2 TaxID=1609232 RepID=A0ACC6UZ92_9CREN|nr:MAG: 30S ribosomal protein S8 [Thermoproteus sp. AZ2]
MLDVLSNALTMIKNAESTGAGQVVIWPVSKLVYHVLRVLQRHGYVGEIEFIDDGRGGKYIVKLLGKINDIGPVKPRYSVKWREIPEWEQKFLPARQIGILVISTPHGVMSHVEAREKRTGGVLLAYVY